MIKLLDALQLEVGLILLYLLTEIKLNVVLVANLVLQHWVCAGIL